MELRIKKLNDHASIPTYGSGKASGLDLSACFPDEGKIVLVSGERRALPTGISIAVPEDHYGRIAPRSGLAFKSGVDVLAGVVDSDYRGEIKVILINLGWEDFTIRHGDRIAQLVIEKISRPVPVVVDDLDDTTRGVGGLGSTGIGKV